MSTNPAPEYSAESTSEVVAANVRAEAARRRMSQMDLVRLTGMSQPTITKRWRGEIDWKLDELDMLARIFRITPADLVTPQDGGARSLRAVRGGNSGYLVAEAPESRPTGIRTQNQRIKGPDEAVASGAMERPVLRLVS